MAVTVMMIKRNEEKWTGQLPDNEDVGVFVDDIAAVVSGGRVYLAGQGEGPLHP